MWFGYWESPNGTRDLEKVRKSLMSASQKIDRLMPNFFYRQVTNNEALTFNDIAPADCDSIESRMSSKSIMQGRRFEGK
jgi:hypothetical protein